MWYEILGRRRKGDPALLGAAVSCARWGWPVVPGTGLTRRSAACRCGRDDCPVPGAHPVDPPVLAASADERMVRWWWSRSPDAPVVLATGSRVAALSVPTGPGENALWELELLGIRTGPVVASPGRHAFLVRPYVLAELAELLDRHGLDRYGIVPTSLRFHGTGGFLALPPSTTRGGPVHWARSPEEGASGVDTTHTSAPWLPRVADLVPVLVDTCHCEPGRAS